MTFDDVGAWDRIMGLKRQFGASESADDGSYVTSDSIASSDSNGEIGPREPGHSGPDDFERSSATFDVAQTSFWDNQVRPPAARTTKTCLYIFNLLKCNLK